MFLNCKNQFLDYLRISVVRVTKHFLYVQAICSFSLLFPYFAYGLEQGFPTGGLQLWALGPHTAAAPQLA